MQRARWLVAAAVSVGWSASLFAAEVDPKGVEFFEKNIRPVLVQQCYKCHSAESGKVKGGLLLDTRDGIRQGGETGHAVVPNRPDESLILSALRHEDFEMPPGKKLPDNVIALFETWVRMGAPDPREGPSAGGGKRVIDIEEGRKFWAFQPPQKTTPPTPKNASWATTDLDRFILAKLEERGLAPSDAARPHELVRRIYFDLTGLPPQLSTAGGTITDAQTGITFDASSAQLPSSTVEQLVDALLDSPQFGERWGRHWLDVARYADSNGNADNTPFPQAWRYRNWVIDAVNADMPYDQFVIHQLAGDLLPFESPAERNRQLVATGFLALGSKPRAQNNPNFQMDVVAEQIEVTTSTMLGLTVACARCHDHKFDPVPTAEFYSLAGIFDSTKTLYGAGRQRKGKNADASGNLIALLPESTASSVELKKYEQASAQLDERQRAIQTELTKRGVANNAEPANKRAAEQIRKLKKRLARLEAAGAPARQIEKAKNQLARLGGSSEKAEPIREADQARVKELQAELAKVQAERKKLQASAPQPAGHSMGVQEGAPRNCAICIAGESTDRGPVVSRGFISVATVGEAPTIPASASGRLQLAEWIASPANPLTARVMVNRIWHHLFGRGLVATVDNFGQLGERPSHPQLLDDLAVRMIEENWSVKQMIRQMILSRTYQMSNRHDHASFTKDPDNVWYWRMNPRRLDAEELRDAILAFSGNLDRSRPEASDLPAYSRRQSPNVRSDGDQRSVYLPIIRNGEPEALMLFDFADPSIVVGAREETTVPAQSLFLMNSPFVVAQSRSAAERILNSDAKTNEARVDRAFLLAYGRTATDEQRSRSVDFLRQMTENLSQNAGKPDREELAAWSIFCQSLIASAEFRYLD